MPCLKNTAVISLAYKKEVGSSLLPTSYRTITKPNVGTGHCPVLKKRMFDGIRTRQCLVPTMVYAQVNFHLVAVEEFGDAFGHGTFPGKGASFIGAIHIRKLAVFLDGADHTAAVLCAAVAAEKSLLFHILRFLYNGKAHRGQGQAVRGAGQPLAVEHHIPGELPVLRAVVDIHRNDFILKTPAEGDFAVFRG